MGGFPHEFPQQAVQAVLRPFLGGTGFNGEVALGAYDLLGFGLQMERLVENSIVVLRERYVQHQQQGYGGHRQIYPHVHSHRTGLSN